ncbi:MAG: hypothetical protein H7249_12285 [Chitinophagaceae bacterium]|nr:hypothetical protein [Oligoflexus sp.]
MANDRKLDIHPTQTIANTLSEEGLLLATLILTEPTLLSLKWGAVLSIVGTLLVFWEHGYVDKLPVISGPYRFVRNPHRVGIWLIAFGLAVAARSFPGLLLVLILLPWLQYLDHEEHRGLVDSQILRYRFHVPALIPTLLPFEATPNRWFSWKRAIRIPDWSSRSKLICFAAIWSYLLVSYNLRLPWWGAIIAASAWILIKLFLLQRKFPLFYFRKKRAVSPNAL